MENSTYNYQIKDHMTFHFMRCNDLSFLSTSFIVFAKKIHIQQQVERIILISVVFQAVYIDHLHIKEKKKHAYCRNAFENKQL